MIEWLEHLDQEIILLINGFRHPVVDEIMWLISSKFLWFPFYIFLFVLVYIKFSLRSAILFTLFGFAAVGLADFLATFVFKEMIARYRPSHHLVLSEQLHFFEFKAGEYYQGGQYGFVSGHATNSFVIALMFIQRLGSTFKWVTPLLLIWAILVCYSRMYLGVHYLSDIIGGALLGSAIAWIFYTVYVRALRLKKD
jgi:undecaprenyl-diphosphatase